MGFLVGLSCVLFGLCASIAIVSSRNLTRRAPWLPVLTLIVTWAWYFWYERVVIACPSCNIRPDLAVIYPFLALVTLLCMIGLGRLALGASNHEAVDLEQKNDAEGK